MASNNYSDTYGYNKDIDPSRWKKPVASGPAPAPVKQTREGMERVDTDDPYTPDNPHVRRNFGAS